MTKAYVCKRNNELTKGHLKFSKRTEHDNNELT